MVHVRSERLGQGLTMKELATKLGVPFSICNLCELNKCKQVPNFRKPLVRYMDRDPEAVSAVPNA